MAIGRYARVEKGGTRPLLYETQSNMDAYGYATLLGLCTNASTTCICLPDLILIERRGKWSPREGDKDNTRLFLELWVSANKLIIDIAKQVLETVYRKLLTRLTSF